VVSEVVMGGSSGDLIGPVSHYFKGFENCFKGFEKFSGTPEN